MLNDKFMSLPPPFVSSRVRVAGLLEVGLLLGLAGSWLGLLGGWHWMLDLGSHFRWQYVVACLLALAWAALTKIDRTANGPQLTWAQLRDVMAIENDLACRWF